MRSFKGVENGHAGAPVSTRRGCDGGSFPPSGAELMGFKLLANPRAAWASRGSPITRLSLFRATSLHLLATYSHSSPGAHQRWLLDPDAGESQTSSLGRSQAHGSGKTGSPDWEWSPGRVGQSAHCWPVEGHEGGK